MLVAQSLIVAARLTAETEPARAGQLHAKAEEVLVENDYKLYDDDLRASQSTCSTTCGSASAMSSSMPREQGRSLTWLAAVSLAQGTLAQLST